MEKTSLTTQTKTRVRTKVAVALLIVGGAVAAAFGIPKMLAARSPDLVVGNLTAKWEIDGSRLYFKGTVANKGDGPAGASRVGIFILDASSTATSIAEAGSAIGPLDPGASQDFTGQIHSTYVAPAPGMRLLASADIERVVSESREGNNNAEIEIPLRVPLAPTPLTPIRFDLNPASPSGAGVPGFNEILRFNVKADAAGGDVYVRNMQLAGGGYDRAGTRWPETGLFRGSWRLYDITDLTTAIGSGIEVNPVRWDGSYWLTEAAVGFGEPGLLVRAGTTRTFILKVDTMGASSDRDDQVRFDVKMARWWTGPGSTVSEAGGLTTASLVIGNTIIY